VKLTPAAPTAALPDPNQGTAQALVEELERPGDLPESVRYHWTAAPTPYVAALHGSIRELTGRQGRKDGEMVGGR